MADYRPSLNNRPGLIVFSEGAKMAKQKIADFSVGLMGRTPDYLNVTFAGFAGGIHEWSMFGNESFAENLINYQKQCIFTVIKNN